jgi:predicted PurR-regulated permease PerM
MVRDLDTNDSWPGFLLFLGIVGGVLSFGWTGLVVGPMAVVVLRVLLGFWLPLYGVGTREPDTDTDTP